MPITITAFQASPDRGKGQARDMRVRWALEEVGQPYDVRFVSFDMMKQADHLALQPFGQIPTYEDGDITLFESGAIALHIAERYSGLLPTEANAHSRAVAWMFAALNTIEPPILDRETAQYTEVNQSWHTQRVPIMDERIRNRLNQLSRQLADADWLDGAFSVGDLVMVGVLRRLSQSPLLSEFPNLVSYIARGEDRPAFKRAFAAQLKAYFRQLDEA